MSVESCTHALTRTSHGVASRGLWAVGICPPSLRKPKHTVASAVGGTLYAVARR